MPRKTHDLEARIQYVGYCATPAEVNQDTPWDETRSDLDESFPGLVVCRGITAAAPAATPDITLTLKPGIARPEAMALVLKMLDFIETDIEFEPFSQLVRNGNIVPFPKRNA